MRKKCGGFTLLELIIVVIIIGILASLGIPMYMKTVESARWEEAADTIKAIKDAEARHYIEKGNFFNLSANNAYTRAPSDTDGLDISWNTRYWNFAITGSSGTCIITATKMSTPEQGNTAILTITNTNLQGTWTGNHSAVPKL